MSRAIILLSGTKDGKEKFSHTVNKESWTRKISPKDYVWETISPFWGINDSEEKKATFLNKQIQTLNKFVNFEEQFLEKEISTFFDDKLVEVLSPENKPYENQFLLVEDFSWSVVENLKDKWGDLVWAINISRKDLNSSVELSDFTVYEDEPAFEENVKELLDKLMSKKKGN